MIGSVPDEVLEALLRLKGIPSGSSPCRVESLSANHPVFRVGTPVGSWIIKESHEPVKAIIVADLFKAWSIPGFSVEELAGDWLVLEDLGLPTLGAHLSERAADGSLCFQLGVVAAQADLVGMRDRKPANLLVSTGGHATGPGLVLIDYEGAFCAGIFDRAIRPRLYLAYLLKRLFVRVLESSRSRPGPGPGPDRDLLLDRFREGFLCEQERLGRVSSRLPWTRRPLSWRQRLVLKTRIRNREGFSAALPGALQLASRSPHPRA